jgi:hypothetical protein
MLVKAYESNSVENHALSDALFANYNFVRIHKTLRVTPAMRLA